MQVAEKKTFFKGHSLVFFSICAAECKFEYKTMRQKYLPDFTQNFRQCSVEIFIKTPVWVVAGAVGCGQFDALPVFIMM